MIWTVRLIAPDRVSTGVARSFPAIAASRLTRRSWGPVPRFLHPTPPLRATTPHGRGVRDYRPRRHSCLPSRPFSLPIGGQPVQRHRLVLARAPVDRLLLKSVCQPGVIRVSHDSDPRNFFQIPSGGHHDHRGRRATLVPTTKPAERRTVSCKMQNSVDPAICRRSCNKSTAIVPTQLSTFFGRYCLGPLTGQWRPFRLGGHDVHRQRQDTDDLVQRDEVMCVL